ncbi:MAG: TspO/MBR family protein [Nitriliruptoraceae bacterium]
MTPTVPDRTRDGLALVGWVLLALAAGGVGSVLQGGDVAGRYLALERPGWAPPSWAFGVVWPVLYVLIGVAAWRVWRRARDGRAVAVPLGLWGLQLVLNAVWPWVFFGQEAFTAAIGVIVVLDAVVLATLVAMARVDRVAAWLLAPYLAWLGYATALNIAVAQAN